MRDEVTMHGDMMWYYMISKTKLLYTRKRSPRRIWMNGAGKHAYKQGSPRLCISNRLAPVPSLYKTWLPPAVQHFRNVDTDYVQNLSIKQVYGYELMYASAQILFECI